MKQLLTMLTILSIFIIVLFLTVSVSYSSTYRIIQITDNDYDDKDFQINTNGEVVWSGKHSISADDEVSTDYEVFVYESDSGSTTQLTINDFNEHSPQININGDIVWFGYDDVDSEIFLRNRSDGTITQLTVNTLNDNSPQLNAAGAVVWVRRFLYSGSEIRIDDGSGDVLVDWAYDSQHPQINALGHVVWYQRKTSGHNYEVFYYDGSRVTVLSTGDTYTSQDYFPKINNNGDVVWYGYDGSGSEIFLRDGSTGNVSQLTDNDFFDVSPQINNNGDVVWYENWIELGVSSHEIFLYHSSSGETEQLTFNSAYKVSPQINDYGDVVWEGKYNLDPLDESTDSEIFFYDSTSGEIIQLTINDYDDTSPRINARGDIVWRGEHNNSDYEIFLAKPNTEPTADAGPDLTISNDEQSSTTIEGIAADPDGDPMTYRWLEQGNELSTWQDVGQGGEADLDLSLLAELSAGQHTLILEVSDGLVTSTDEMVLTINAYIPSPISGFSIFATNSVRVHPWATVEGGHIGVQDESASRYYKSKAEVKIGWHVYLEDDVSIYADTVWIKKGASVHDVHHNELKNNGTIRATTFNPLQLPLDVSLPDIPASDPGTDDYVIPRRQTLVLDPGSYGKIKIRSHGKLLLTGGTYHLKSLYLDGFNAKVLFEGPTELIIDSHLKSGIRSFIGPEDGSGISAKDIRIYVHGNNGKYRRWHAFLKPVRIGWKSDLRASICAPNSTIWVGHGTSAEGALIGKDVVIGSHAHVTQNSAF
jgi:hypothetical protein